MLNIQLNELITLRTVFSDEKKIRDTKNYILLFLISNESFKPLQQIHH